MEPIERIIATYNGEKTDQIPVDAWWSKEIYEKIKSEKKESPIIRYKLDTRRIYIEAQKLQNNWKKFLKREDPEIPIYEFPFPEIEMAKTNRDELDIKINNIKKQGYPAIGHIGSVCFEALNNLLGMEEVFIALFDKYDIIDEICEEITNIKLDMAMKFVENGINIVHMGDDFGSQKGLLVSPDIWRRLFKPKIGRIINSIKKQNKDCLVFFHSDGDISEIMADFIEIGIDFLNPIQPECMDIEMISKRYAGNIAFWGGVGTQETFYRDRDFIFETIKRTIEVLGRKDKLVISPTHMIQGDVPLKNIDYFFEAVKLYGSNQ